LDEGPVMMTNIVGDSAETIAIGERVSVMFQKVSNDVTMPVFQRTASGA
jgi:uncharacterized OB-fold protein